MNQQNNNESQQALATWNDQKNTEVVADKEETISTTDIIPYSTLEYLVSPLRDGTQLPIHEQMLMNGNISELGEQRVYTREQVEIIADMYYGHEPKSLKAFGGRIMKVYGMILFEQPGGWKGKDGLWHPEGYFQVRMLVEDEETKGNPIVVVKSSGAGLARHVYHILNNRGWFLFEQPQHYRVEVGEDNSHRIFNVDHDVKKLLAGKGKINVSQS